MWKWISVGICDIFWVVVEIGEIEKQRNGVFFLKYGGVWSVVI